ncbi:hypothetical protein ACFUJR_06580, partial [Streptomyces sp. NPDC057271]|uniref:WXG100-like domain-containing protein n=1 Tax=Streptomyces sp. NPDC057271 TaxID=3346078 RepID=UPI0036426F96
MGDIEVPEWAEGALGALGGQAWPQLSESALVAESLEWEAVAGFVRELEARFGEEAYGAARSMEGEGARAMEESVRGFLEGVGPEQELPAFQQIAKYAQDTADNLRKTAIQVETTKVTILGMVAWLVVQLAMAAASLVVTFGASAAVSAGVWAAIKAAIPMIVRQLISEILMGAVIMGGLNVAAQVVGFAKGTRREFGLENLAEVGINVGMGAIGGAIGFGVGKVFTAGVTKALGAKAA